MGLMMTKFCYAVTPPYNVDYSLVLMWLDMNIGVLDDAWTIDGFIIDIEPGVGFQDRQVVIKPKSYLFAHKEDYILFKLTWA